MFYTKAELNRLHAKSFKNEPQLRATPKNTVCGCFYCREIFTADDVRECDILPEADGVGTIWCPYCNIDSVMISDDETQVTPELLDEMHKAFFQYS